MTAPTQHMSALARANQVRFAHSRLKKSISRLSCQEGLLRVSDILNGPVDGPEGSLSLCDLLLSVRRVGPDAMREICASCGVWDERKHLAALTDRQRTAVAMECERRAVR